MSLLLRVESKTYPNGVQALGSIDLTISEGEFVAIVGPSGAGKTTLLKIVAGLDQDYKGQIKLTTSSLSQGALATAFMFQEPRLMPWLTVADNIRLVIPPLQREPLEARLNQLLTQAGLSEFAQAYPKQLSGGMMRRVALLRAFIMSPALLLMDEPFQALDAPTANQLRQMLLTLWQETRSTVLFVTHSLREALMLADRVVFLSARPSTVILDYRLSLPRPREIESSAIHELHQTLLTQYPMLLSGAVSEDSYVSC